MEVETQTVERCETEGKNSIFIFFFVCVCVKIVENYPPLPQPPKKPVINNSLLWKFIHSDDDVETSKD